MLERILSRDRFPSGHVAYLNQGGCPRWLSICCYLFVLHTLYAGEGKLCLAESELSRLHTAVKETSCKGGDFDLEGPVHLTGCSFEDHVAKPFTSHGFADSLPDGGVSSSFVRVRAQVFMGHSWREADAVLKGTDLDSGLYANLGSFYNLSSNLTRKIPMERVQLRKVKWQTHLESSDGKLLKRAADEALSSANMWMFEKEDRLYSQGCSCTEDKSPGHFDECISPSVGEFRVWFEKPSSSVSILASASSAKHAQHRSIVLSEFDFNVGYLDKLGSVAKGRVPLKDMLKDSDEEVEEVAWVLRILLVLVATQLAWNIFWPADAGFLCGCCNCASYRTWSTLFRAALISCTLCAIPISTGWIACHCGVAVAMLIPLALIGLAAWSTSLASLPAELTTQPSNEQELEAPPAPAVQRPYQSVPSRPLSQVNRRRPQSLDCALSAWMNDVDLGDSDVLIRIVLASAILLMLIMITQVVISFCMPPIAIKVG